MPTLTTKTMIFVGLFAAILLFIWLVQGRMGCETWRQKHRDERHEKRTHRTVECQVKSIADGATLEVSWGLRNRQTRVVRLDGISVPPAAAAAAKTNLESLTSGGTVRIEYETRVIFGNESDDEPPEMEATAITGMVFGDGNQCCNVEQVLAGVAKAEAEADPVIKAAEKQAIKAKRGIWKDTR